MPLRPRPEIQELNAAVHGGFDHDELRKLKLDPEEVLDFSVCTNHFIESPDMNRLAKATRIRRYPDSNSTALRRRIAGAAGVPSENIIAGNGTTDLIRLVALTYFGPGDKVIIPEPTFGEYRAACRISGSVIIHQYCREEEDFRLDTEEAVNLLRIARPKGMFLCNPNNPTGEYLSAAAVEKLLDAGKNTLFVIDEAYVSFVEDGWPSHELVRRKNVIILRSMTKDYALPGLRLGYAIAARRIIREMKKTQQPWSVNAMAQQAGMAVLREREALRESLAATRQAGDYLKSELRRIGMEPIPSETNFVLVKVDGAPEFRKKLLEKGIMVRDCTSFGMPDHIRIGVRREEDCRALIEAIETILGRDSTENRPEK